MVRILHHTPINAMSRKHDIKNDTNHRTLLLCCRALTETPLEECFCARAGLLGHSFGPSGAALFAKRLAKARSLPAASRRARGFPVATTSVLRAARWSAAFCLPGAYQKQN
jgi:hypothetical protein